MPEDKLTIYDFIKGFAILAGIVVIAIASYFLAMFIISIPVIAFLDSNINAPFKAFIAAIILVFFSILSGFGKASGEGFGLAKGYNALKDFMSYLFKKK